MQIMLELRKHIRTYTYVRIHTANWTALHYLSTRRNGGGWPGVGQSMQGDMLGEACSEVRY